MKSAKPAIELNFFQNYSNHLKYMTNKFDESVIGLIKNKDMGDELLKHATIFEPLHDAHDYCDEVVGATAMSVAAMLHSLIFLYKSCENLFNMAAFKYSGNKYAMDKQSHYAVSNLKASAVSLFLAVAIFAKSCISLVTRPIVTMAQGWNKDTKTDRFWSDDTDVTHHINGRSVTQHLINTVNAADPVKHFSSLASSM